GAIAVRVIALLAIIAAFVSAPILLRSSSQPVVASFTAQGDSDILKDVAVEAGRDDVFGDVYPYSVIPGGVASATELAGAIDQDPAVAQHYSDVAPAAVHVDAVDAPREAYMSYRIGDEIYWTKRKLALHPGERILTDGRVTVRGRCGNRLS